MLSLHPIWAFRGFRKGVEGVRGGGQRTRIKIGSNGGEEEKAAGGWIGGKLIGVTHTWAIILFLFSCVRDESSYGSESGQRSATPSRPGARPLHQPNPFPGSRGFQSQSCFFSYIHPNTQSHSCKADVKNISSLKDNSHSTDGQNLFSMMSNGSVGDADGTTCCWF